LWQGVFVDFDVLLVWHATGFILRRILKSGAAPKTHSLHYTMDPVAEQYLDLNATLLDSSGKARSKGNLVVDNKRSVASNKVTIAAKISWDGTISRIVDQTTRKRGWVADPVYPVIIR